LEFTIFPQFLTFQFGGKFSIIWNTIIRLEYFHLISSLRKFWFLINFSLALLTFKLAWKLSKMLSLHRNMRIFVIENKRFLLKRTL
jgi:hypothetical protein